MNYAVIETGGKQYRVNPGLVVEIEKIEAKPGEEYSFDKVLLYVFDGKVLIGKPYLKDISVSGKVLDVVKGEKVEVVKFRAKSKYRRKTGYRHLFSKIMINSIEEKGDSKKSKEVKEKAVKK